MMKPSQIDRVASLAVYMLLAGVGVGYLGGTLTAYMLFVFSLNAGRLASWRTERGLWMLATLCMCFFGPVYIYLAVAEIAGWLTGVAPLVSYRALDVALGTLVLGLKTRFLWAVIVLNWRMSMAEKTS